MDFKRVNKKLKEKGQKEMRGDRIIEGISKITLTSEFFLSAASMQEPVRILTDAAIAGVTDKLDGVISNVIMGNLIPAGTGLKKYKKNKR